MAKKPGRLLNGDLQWGVSAECESEEQMGVLIAAATVLGCTNIAWTPIRPERVKGAGGTGTDEAKNPNRVEGAKKAAAVRKKRKGDRRKPSTAVGAEFLAAHPADFQVSDLAKALKKAGYASATAAYPLVNAWIKAGSVKRTGVGTYQNLTRKAA